MNGQLSIEFLVIFAILLTYFAASVALLNEVKQKLHAAALKFTINHIADEIEFYLSIFSGKGNIKVLGLPNTRITFESGFGELIVKGHIAGTNLTEERRIKTEQVLIKTNVVHEGCILDVTKNPDSVEVSTIC